ncbi:DNA-directed RNA polymerase subunit A'' [Candidatus Woesearchaeota archaeon]|nr:DNA-directed RNA polymerase subunit A'' [Candidatus Woesearchaeota archaeon]
MRKEHEEYIESFAGKLPQPIITELKEIVPNEVTKEQLTKILEKVSLLYNRARVHPGESVGLVSAESIGEPGTQMSLDSEEKVIVKHQNKIKIVKIGEFIDQVLETKNDIRKNGNSEVGDTSNMALFVPALSPHEKIEWKKVTAVSRHPSPAALLKIRTRSKRTITATPYHSFVIRKNNRVVPIAGSTLKLGDRIPVVRRMDNLTSNQFLNLKEHLPPAQYVYESELRKAMNKEQGFILPLRSYEQINNYVQGRAASQLQQECVYMHQHRGAAALPEIMPLDFQFGFLIGAYLAEGTHTKNYVAISNISDEYLQQVIGFAQQYNIHYKIKYELGEYGKSTSLLLYSTLLADLLNTMCGRGAHHKYVPHVAYSGHSSFVRGLLQAYFDGDGNVNVSRKVIRVSSCSPELLNGIALLLTQLGIFAVKGKNKRQDTLSISYRYAQTFLEQIDSVIPPKRASLEKLTQLPATKTSYDSIDMISGLGNVLSVLGQRFHIPSRLLHKFTRKQKIGRQALKKYLTLFEQVAQEQKINIDSELKMLLTAVNSDVIWDEITSLEMAAPTTGFVYDFSVEDLETFTTFEGIVTHNTLNTFHFAGVSEMNVTTGLPRIIEVFDSRKEISTPMMEIHFQGATAKDADAVKRFAAKIKETKVGDLVSEYSVNIFEQTLKVKFNLEVLSDHELSTKEMAKLLKAKAKGFEIGTADDEVIFTHKGKAEEVKKVYALKEKIGVIKIKGIKGIKQVLPVKRDEELVILTAGTNLKEILALPEVDIQRTTTNDIYEIYEVLGIEAARQAIINEVYKVIEAQGLNVNVRHVMLVSDIMCASGTVKGITRYGVVSEKASVLARASFETPIKHLITAALEGEVDYLTSVVENVMINQPVPIGTGLPSLVTKMK